MKLKNFERYVDQVIVDRGRNYYWGGRVEQLEVEGDKLYVAKVSGTDDYSVSVQLNDQGTVVLAECDCPYEDGPYCKHMVAVFYAIREEWEDNRVSNISGNAERSGKEKAPKVNLRDQLQQDLSYQSKEKLIQLLLVLVDEYPELRDRLGAEFTTGTGETEKWVRLMRRYARKAVDDDGFLSYQNCHHAIEGAYKVAGRAHRAVDEKQYELAIDLLVCVMREMVELLQFSEDFTEEIIEVMDEVNGLLARGAKDIAGSPASAACFQKLLREAVAAHYTGWEEWRTDLLHICVDLTTTDQQRKQLEQYLDALLTQNQSEADEERSFFRKYEAEAITMVKYRLIDKLDGHHKATDFLYEHRYFSRFRELAIQEAMTAGQYAKAEELALEGETQDETLPGLVQQWKESRFEVYRLWGRLDKMRTVARELALQGEFKYYQKLKASYDLKEWLDIYPSIMDMLAKEPKFLDSAYTAVLIEEREWAKLWEYVQKRPKTITNFYRHLLPNYREQVYELFSQMILDDASQAHKRSAYQGICSDLRLLARIGGGKISAELIERLLQLNPRKPAFCEELKNTKVK